jgi:hypothetical protein
MMRLLPVVLAIAGAILGGGFPGAVLAFFFAAATGVGGAPGEVVCLVANLLLGAGGAFCGMLTGKTIQESQLRWVDVGLSCLMGLIVGAVGYSWLVWELRHADPPL